MIRNHFSGDYKQNDEGRFEYVGQLYKLPLDEKGKKRTNWINFFFVILFFAGEIGLGLINQESSRTIWILLPYFTLFLPMAYFAVGAYSYATSPAQMERAAYRGSILRMHRSVLGIIILSVINMALDLVYIVTHKPDIFRELLYIGGFAVILVIAIGFALVYNRNYARVTVE